MMADYDEDEDFYEEDELAEGIHAAFERGQKGITGPPLYFHFVTESLNTGLVPYTALIADWITGDNDTEARNTGSVPLSA
jgi:hypothetical protein